MGGCGLNSILYILGYFLYNINIILKMANYLIWGGAESISNFSTAFHLVKVKVHFGWLALIFFLL
jgi:hypothetical protein